MNRRSDNFNAMDLSEILSPLAGDLEEVENEIEINIRSEIPLVYEISQYLLDSGGKRIRPCVVLLSSGALGLAEGRERIRAAAALELIHTASLLHDDVVDEAELRRGVRSANVVWGNHASVLVGDFLLARALNLMNSCGDVGVIDSITRAAGKLAEGQVLEAMSSKKLLASTEEMCLKIIEYKTASLLESCGEVGAILADASPREREAVTAYSRNVGFAFQIIDDALDYAADETEFGKRLGQDIREGKMTLPLLYSMERATEEERRRVMDIMNNGQLDEEQTREVLEMVRNYGGTERCAEVAERYVEAAKSSLEAIGDSPFKDSLLELADFIVRRTR